MAEARPNIVLFMMDQLFRIGEDPEEQRNLAGDPACAGVRRELRDLVILQDYPHSPREVFSLGVH